MFRILVFDVFCAVGDQVLLNVPDAQHVVCVREYFGEGVDESLFLVRDHEFRKGDFI